MNLSNLLSINFILDFIYNAKKMHKELSLFESHFFIDNEYKIALDRNILMDKEIKLKRLLYLFQELEKSSNETLEQSLKDLLLNSNPLFNGLDENSKSIISENLEKNIVEFEKENS